MKKGTVITLSLSHKNLKHVFKTGDEVTEETVNNFDELVKKGFIKETVLKAKKATTKKAE